MKVTSWWNTAIPPDMKQILDPLANTITFAYLEVVSHPFPP